jgi:farnesyl diphosphate synthase
MNPAPQPQGVPAQPPFDFSAWSDTQRRHIEAALDTWVNTDGPAALDEAMRYAVLDGGKRLRPLLVLAAAQACGSGNSPAALRAACSAELIHAYSLVHDDMPCMDNDVLRRGKPTVHVRYGEAQALLVGDALQALAFELLTSPEMDVAVQARCCAVLARAAGASGMAGGQAMDLAHVGVSMPAAELERMHSLKTGALLAACIDLGMACAQEGDLPDPAVRALRTCGQALGLAFQLVDDVLDATQDVHTLGKTAGKDAQNHKPTYVTVLGLEETQRRLQELHHIALQALRTSDLQAANTQPLCAIAHWVIERTH